MKRPLFLASAAGLALLLVLTPGLASAQDADTLSVCGPFFMDSSALFGGPLGADLLAVYARHGGDWWSLTLHGVTYARDYYYDEQYDEFGDLIYLDERYTTTVYATSFEFKFNGFDAEVLNQVVSSQLTRGGEYGGGYLVMTNGYTFDASDEFGGPGAFSAWGLGLAPVDPAAGISFTVEEPQSSSRFPTDADGYPIIQPGPLFANATLITDDRPGNAGAIISYSDVIQIGSAGPIPPLVSIADASVLEGNKGTTLLHLPVSLSWVTDHNVTLNFATADGTALSRSDYTSTTGKLTFSPGQTTATITVPIQTDRKREPNETFSVRLSSVVGATVLRGVATATILNDD